MVFQFLPTLAPAPGLIDAVQRSFVGTLLPPLLNSLDAAAFGATYLTELQAVLEALNAALPLFADAAASERAYASHPQGLNPAAVPPATPPTSAARTPALNLATLAPMEMCTLHWLHDLKFSVEYLAAAIACKMVGTYGMWGRSDECGGAPTGLYLGTGAVVQ